MEFYKVMMSKNVLVSSANRTGIAFPFITAGISFMYKRKSMGHNTEPCVTPCLILAQFETVVLWFVLLSIRTRWYQPLMYD